MRAGYTAVVVPASVKAVESLLRDLRPGAHVVELAHGVIALETVDGQQDTGAYALLAERAAELFGSGVVAHCSLMPSRQSAHVFRQGHKPQLLRSPSAGPRDATPRSVDPLDESEVAAPLADGLALAGLKGAELAALLCKQLGKHEHPPQLAHGG